MKKWISLGVVILLFGVLMTGCMGGSSTPDPVLTALTTRVTEDETKITTLEGKVNALPNLTTLTGDVTALKTDIATIKAQLAGSTAYVTPAQLASAVANWEAQYNTLNARVISLDARVTVLEARPTVQASTQELVKAAITAGQMALQVTLNAARSMAVEFKFIPTSPNITAASYQAALDELYTSIPATMNIGIALVPVYSLQKTATNVYTVVCVTFLTPPTSFVAGTTNKLITVTGVGTWEVRLIEVATVSGGTSTW